MNLARIRFWPFVLASRAVGRLGLIVTQQEFIMSQIADLAATLSTNSAAVAARFDKMQSDLATVRNDLAAAIAAAGEAPTPDVIAQLQAVSDKLKALSEQ